MLEAGIIIEGSQVITVTQFFPLDDFRAIIFTRAT